MSWRTYIPVIVLALFACFGARAQSDGKYTVEAVKPVNGPDNDFAPFFLNDTLYFCSTRPIAWNLEPMPKTVMYTKPLNQKDSIEPKPLDKSLQNAIHQGPITIVPTGDTAYFSRTKAGAFQGKKTSSKLQIAMGVKKAGKWHLEEDFAYNKDGYNSTHPSLSDMGQYLYFSSNRPGGQGGMDIWRCKRDSGKWAPPQNLGPLINGPGNEVFPFAYKGNLYYSSDGGNKENDLDIYKTIWDGIWSTPEPMASPVNSPADDLGITFVRSGLAYFSSNRGKENGDDNIYRMKNPEIMAKNFNTLKGSLTYRNKPAGNVNIRLYDKNEHLLQEVVSDTLGEFKLSDVDGSRDYSIKIVPDSGNVKQGYVLTLFNDRGEEVRKLAQNENGNFQFELLSPEDFDNLQVLTNPDESILDISLNGQVYEDKRGDIGQGLVVYVMDENNNVMRQTPTTTAGKFSFAGLTAKDAYRLRVNIDYKTIRIVIFGRDGAIEQTLLQDENGDFTYERLSNEDNYVTMLNEDDISINVKFDQNFKIPNIYFAYARSNILPKSEKALGKLIGLLNKNPHIGAKIESHTDSRGSDSYNMKLSKKRAHSTVDYLVAHGIDKDRLTWEGKGETELLNKCANGVDCPEAMHQKNRRTEFSVRKIQNASEPTSALEKSDHPQGD